jgi:hypothetical protein
MPHSEKLPGAAVYLNKVSFFHAAVNPVNCTGKDPWMKS